MTTKNEHTGATQQTKPATDAFREGWDRIFGGASVVENTAGCEPADEGSIPRVTPKTPAQQIMEEEFQDHLFGINYKS